MKKLVFVLLAIFPILLNAQPLTIREVQKPQEELVPIPRYDTLSNMRYHKSLEEYKMYIGQDILFYPRNKNSTVEVNYYGNFKLLVPDTLFHAQPDTIWIKKRRKVRPEDFTVHYPISDTYKPVYVNNQAISLRTAKYTSLPPRLTSEIKTGYYTPYQEIEGKIFRIMDCDVETGSLGWGMALFTLKDEAGHLLKWEAQRPENENCGFPVIIVSYYEKMRSDYVGKTFFTEAENKSSSLPDYLRTHYYGRNIRKGGKYTKLEGELKCTDLVLLGNENDYMTPKLMFEDSNGEELAVNIAPAPTLSNYLKVGLSSLEKVGIEKSLYGDVFADGKQPVGNSYAISLDKLIDTEVVYERQRIAEEQRLAREKKIQEEKEARKATLIRKYGKYNGTLISDGYVQTGFTKQMCIDSWGEPSDINKSSGSWGVHEQWVYRSGNYLYFENGILTSIQN